MKDRINWGLSLAVAWWPALGWATEPTRNDPPRGEVPPTLVGESRRAANRAAVARLRRAIDLDYSHRDLRGVDWAGGFAEFAPQLEAADTPREFALAAAKLLAPAGDLHLWLKVGEVRVSPFRRKVEWNIAGRVLERSVPGWERPSAAVAVGAFPDGIRYLGIQALPAETPALLEPAFVALDAAAKAGASLILDLRANSGGGEGLARAFAGCFIDEPVVYAKHVVRRDGKFGDAAERTLAPNPRGPRFRGRVVVLIGRGTVSSGEAFAMMMKQVPGSVLMGAPTAGASGNPQPVDLGNGVVAFVPCWRSLRVDGTGLEGEGLAPDVVVMTTLDDFRAHDPVLDAALSHLRAATRRAGSPATRPQPGP